MSDALREMLRAAIEGDAAALARVLHPRVRLRRMDGADVLGRQAVLSALAVAQPGSGYAFEAPLPDGWALSLRVEGVPGALRFTLRGRCRQGRLDEIWVAPDDPQVPTRRSAT
ncbi:MAG: hypothetical protein R3A48_17380 [Polyangiales bacterium]